MTTQLSAKERADLRIAVKAISNEWSTAKAHNASASDMLKEVAKKAGLTPKQLRKIAKRYHNQSHEQEVAEQDELDDLYEEVMLSNSGARTE